MAYRDLAARFALSAMLLPSSLLGCAGSGSEAVNDGDRIAVVVHKDPG